MALLNISAAPVKLCIVVLQEMHYVVQCKLAAAQEQSLIGSALNTSVRTLEQRCLKGVCRAASCK